MAISDDRLCELAAVVDRGAPVSCAEVAELIREATMWRSKFCQLVSETLRIADATENCIERLDERHDRELDALRSQNRVLAQASHIVIGDSTYDHDPEGWPWPR